MSEAPSRHKTRRRRLRGLLGVLGVLAVAWSIAPAPGRLGGHLAGGGMDRPSWMTDEAVLKGLDGQKAAPLTESGAGGRVDLIPLRREAISSLKTRPGGDDEAFAVEFDLDDEGQRYRVEGKLAWRMSNHDGHEVLEFYPFDGFARPVSAPAR